MESVINFHSTIKMKHVLIIDDRGTTRHPGIEKFNFIEFFDKVEDPQKLNKDLYEIAIVHQRNAIEASWAKRNFKMVFIVSGGIDSISVNKNVINISREIYERFAEQFLYYYSISGKIDAEIFRGKKIEI